jgi:hypothetical protein
MKDNNNEAEALYHRLEKEVMLLDRLIAEAVRGNARRQLFEARTLLYYGREALVGFIPVADHRRYRVGGKSRARAGSLR